MPQPSSIFLHANACICSCPSTDTTNTTTQVPESTHTLAWLCISFPGSKEKFYESLFAFCRNRKYFSCQPEHVKRTNTDKQAAFASTVCLRGVCEVVLCEICRYICVYIFTCIYVFMSVLSIKFVILYLKCIFPCKHICTYVHLPVEAPIVNIHMRLCLAFHSTSLNIHAYLLRYVLQSTHSCSAYASTICNGLDITKYFQIQNYSSLFNLKYSLLLLL